MSRLLSILLLVVIACTACSTPFAGSNSGFLPVEGEYSGLIPLGKRKTYILNNDRNEFLGKNAALYESYGLVDFFHNDYTFGGDTNYLSIESFNFAGENGAAGVFYYFVRRKLRAKGERVDVGADGVLDVQNENRNLYFFKGSWFFSIVYSGKGKIPDLIPLGRFIASKVPGENKKPYGFRYLDVEGISSKYAYVSAGNAMNFAFLPPSVTTFISSVGLESNIFISNYFDEETAEDAADEYRKFLRSQDNYTKSSINVGGNDYYIYQAIDEKEGLLMFTQYKKTIVSMNKVSDIALAKKLFGRVIEKIKTVRIEQ